MGDHSEAIQIDFDESVLSYSDLVLEALSQGSFGRRHWSRQYRSAVFFHTEAQRRTAQQLGVRECEPLAEFTRAEDYHQKYYLRRKREVGEFEAMFPDERAFTDSTAVMRANAIAGGCLRGEAVNDLLPLLGVTERTAQGLLKMAGPQGACPWR